MKSVALYARVSTTDKGQTTATQLRLLRDYAASMGAESCIEYSDTASAADMRGRSQWRALQAKIKRSEISTVLVTKLDRAFRSVAESVTTLQHWQERHVEFRSVTQPVDTSTATGRLLLTMLSAFAEFERDLIRQRVAEGLARAKAEGKRLGRPPGSKDTTKRRTGGYYARYAR